MGRKLKSKLVLLTCVLASSTLCQSTHFIYVSSQATHSVKRYDMNGAFVDDFVASGAGGLRAPQGLTFGPDGHLYVSSWTVGAHSVLKYNGVTGAFMEVVTQGTAMNVPADLQFRGNELLVSCKVGTAGSPSVVARFNPVSHAYLGNAAAGGGLNGTDGVSFDSEGNLYVSSFNTGQVIKYAPDGSSLGVWASTSLTSPLDNRFGAGGDLFVNDFSTGTVKRFRGSDGAFLGDFISGLGQTQGQEIGPDGKLYVGSWSGNFINKYDPVTGASLGPFINAGAGGLSRPNNFVFRAAVPEPSTLIAIGMGVALLGKKRAHR